MTVVRAPSSTSDMPLGDVPMCTLRQLLHAGLVAAVHGDAATQVRGVCSDSRRVEPGQLFAVVRGAQVDGARFVAGAAAAGAAALLCDRPLAHPLPQLQVDDVRRRLGPVAEWVYGRPSEALQVCGVTGTNGKTSTVSMLAAMVAAHGPAPGLLSTVERRIGTTVWPALHTTPEADDISRFAAAARRQGAQHLLMEVSSHALAQHRVDGLRFAVAAFSNLSRDHLDYHGDLDAYRAAKARLFQALTPQMAVFNLDDAVGAALASSHAGPWLGCSRLGHAKADVCLEVARPVAEGTNVRLRTPAGPAEWRWPLVGDFNLDNALLALGCALALGLDVDTCAQSLGRFAGAPGRMQTQRGPDGLRVIVDYAHTPDALQRAADAARQGCAGRLWLVFGCGGDRDAGKRPLMGQAAAQADAVVLTSDNPRSEAPEAIAAAVAPGLRQGGLLATSPQALAAGKAGFLCELDRRAAIHFAVRQAAASDVVLVAGKGHEREQLVGSQRLAFDDALEVAAALQTRGEGRG
ncbi:MAG: UDP-N-acetylmuramoyl-L-alanyl-D-glutamate--2,6-diaminopimelate ligase [Polyangiales bacterium]